MHFVLIGIVYQYFFDISSVPLLRLLIHQESFGRVFFIIILHYNSSCVSPVLDIILMSLFLFSVSFCFLCFRLSLSLSRSPSAVIFFRIALLLLLLHILCVLLLCFGGFGCAPAPFSNMIVAFASCP